MNARDIARDLAVLKVLSERLREARVLLEKQARELMEPVDRLVVRVDDEVVGAVTVVNGRRTARVVDAAALLAWVKDNRPTEVQTVESVRSSYVTAVLSAAKDLGVAVDSITGELVPGIEVTVGDPYPMIRLTADADAVVSLAWQAGRLQLPGVFLPALTEEAG